MKCQVVETSLFSVIRWRKVSLFRLNEHEICFTVSIAPSFWSRLIERVIKLFTEEPFPGTYTVV